MFLVMFHLCMSSVHSDLARVLIAETSQGTNSRVMNMAEEIAVPY